MNTAQKLYRSNTEKVIGGVAGGLGDYLNIDTVIVRIIFILLAIFGGSGVLVYIILWIAIPAQTGKSKYQVYEAPATDDMATEQATVPAEPVSARKLNSSMVAGIVMVAIGLLFLFDGLLPMMNLWNFWPILLVVAGVLLIRPELIKSSK